MIKHLTSLDYLREEMPYLYSYDGHAVYDVSKCIEQYTNYFLNFYGLGFSDDFKILKPIQFLRLNYPDIYGDDEHTINDISILMDDYINYLINLL